MEMVSDNNIHLIAPSTLYNKGDAAIYVGALNLVTQSLPNHKFSVSITGYDERKDMNERIFNFNNVSVTQGLLDGIKDFLLKKMGPSQLLFKKRVLKREGTQSEYSRDTRSYLNNFYREFRLFRYWQMPFIISNVIKKLDMAQEPFDSIRTSQAAVILGHNLSTSVLPDCLLSYSIPKLTFQKKTVIFPISVSQFPYSPNKSTNKLMEHLTRCILEKMNSIFLRESYSFESLRNRLNVRNNNVFFGADTAFLLPKEKAHKVLDKIKNQGIELEKPAFAVTIRGRDYFKVHRNQIMVDYYSFISNFARALDILIKKLGVSIYFVPMTMLRPNGLDEYDYHGCLRILNEMKLKQNANIINTWDFTPSEIATLLEQMEFVVTMRLHQMITASTVNVPSVLILPSQEIKALGILQEVGLIDYFVNAGAHPSNLYKNILKKAIKGYENRDLLSDKIKSRLPSIKERIFVTGKILHSLVMDT